MASFCPYSSHGNNASIKSRVATKGSAEIAEYQSWARIRWCRSYGNSYGRAGVRAGQLGEHGLVISQSDDHESDVDPANTIQTRPGLVDKVIERLIIHNRSCVRLPFRNLCLRA
jgi:hypothetical protein